MNWNEFFPNRRQPNFYYVLAAVIAASVFVLYNLWFGYNAALYYFVLLVLAVIGARAPVAGLIAAFVCTMWWERYFTLQPIIVGETAYKFYPLDFVLLFSGLGLIKEAWRGKIFWRWHNFDLPAVFFAVFVTLAYANSFFSARVDPAVAFGTYKNYLLYGAVYILAVLLLRAAADWREFMNWFSVGGAGLFVFLFYGLVTGHGLWSEFTPLSTPGERLIAGTHVFYLILFGFWLLAHYLWPVVSERLAAARFGRYLLPALLATVALAVLVSLVRHLWVALFLVFLIYLKFLATSEKRTLFVFIGKVALGLSAAAALVFLTYSLWQGGLPPYLRRAAYVITARVNPAEVITLRDSSFSWRFSSWQAGLAAWSERPFLGVGLGRVISGLGQEYSYDIAVREIHNNYLAFLVQMGLWGALFVAGWLFTILYYLYQAWERLKNEDSWSRRFTFAWGSAALLFAVVFSVSVYWDVNLFVIWWWLTLSALRFVVSEQV